MVGYSGSKSRTSCKVFGSTGRFEVQLFTAARENLFQEEENL
jgi:hypothetical protein